jgi:import receptor subunit TOM22
MAAFPTDSFGQQAHMQALLAHMQQQLCDLVQDESQLGHTLGPWTSDSCALLSQCSNSLSRTATFNMATSAASAMDGVVSQAKYVARRLSKSVGKAAWLASTTLIVLLLPLVIEMDREQQLLEMEKDQMSVLTSPKSS